MMVLIIGGSGSGKSRYAEDYLLSLAPKQKKYYLATMQAFGEEAKKRIQKHRKMREGKGFVTIEQQTEIEHALTQMEPGDKAALLECMSNLAANEMFAHEVPCAPEEVRRKIGKGICRLAKEADPLVIVTNNVFEDGIEYDAGTISYLQALGQINQDLAALADEVIEVVQGYPVFWKGEQK